MFPDGRCWQVCCGVHCTYCRVLLANVASPYPVTNVSWFYQKSEAIRSSGIIFNFLILRSFSFMFHTSANNMCAYAFRGIKFVVFSTKDFSRSTLYADEPSTV